MGLANLSKERNMGTSYTSIHRHLASFVYLCTAYITFMHLKAPSSLFIQLHYTNFVLLYQAFIHFHFHFFPLKYLTTFFPCNHHHFSSIILTLLHPMTFMYLHPPSKILCSFIILSSSKIQHPLSTIYLYNVYSFSCPFNLSLSFITIIH